MDRAAPQSHPFSAQRAAPRMLLFWVEHDLFGKPASPFPDHAQCGGTSPRLMMSYFSLSASISLSSANCCSLKPASSARN